jgi:hypothetical protein
VENGLPLTFWGLAQAGLPTNLPAKVLFFLFYKNFSTRGNAPLAPNPTLRVSGF